MARSLHRWLVVSTILFGLGMHWAILQSVAWTGMIISYSQHSSFREALEKTFDGHHPCSVCKLVKSGQRSEQSHDRLQLVLKLDLFIHNGARASLFPPHLEPAIVRLIDNYCWSADSPPTPPPILG